MKTKGMKHQLEAMRRMRGRKFFALFMEQGTGKTWCYLKKAEELYTAGEIDAVLVIAPKGVHTNWVRREIPAHWEGKIIARAWQSGAGVKAMALLQKLFEPRDRGEQPPMRVLSMNIDALNTNAGFEYAAKFLRATRAMIVFDESSRGKNPKAERMKALMKLRTLAGYVLIGSGTPITNAPTDVFAPFEFMESGLLGTDSHRAFIAEYSSIMSPDHPMMKRMVQKNPRIAFAQIVERDKDGAPIWRNLEKLQALIAPHSYRVLKQDCLDLPEKIYKQVYFDLAPAQKRAYAVMENQFRIELGNDSIEAVSKLNSITKLQQITSGFVMSKTMDGTITIGDDNPRLAALLSLIEDINGQFIIWARFREELRIIAAALREAGITTVEYHGGITSSKARDEAVDDFQAGRARAFVGQPQSGGIGLTLTAAENVIYYSNDYNLETRLQSEDRAHRIGTKRNVVYTDIVAEDTIDEPIAQALQRKANVAAIILNDPACFLDERRAA